MLRLSFAAATHRSYCNCLDIALMIVWRTMDERVSELSACATHPEFVNHLVLSVTVWNVSGNLFMKSTTVGRSQLLAECESV